MAWEKFVEDVYHVLVWHEIMAGYRHDPFATVNFTMEEFKEGLLANKEHFEERWDINEKVSG